MNGELVSGNDDRRRFADVVMPHLGDAYSLAHWLTGNAADAEDGVQEACVRAFRAVGGHSGNARAWTLTIVRHTALSWLAKNRRNTVVAGLGPLGGGGERARPPDAQGER